MSTEQQAHYRDERPPRSEDGQRSDERSVTASSMERQREEDNKSRQSHRYHSLSKPKIFHYKQTKWINRGTEVKWGTQEQLTPPTDAAKNATASPRVEELARAKTDKQENVNVSDFYYSCGRVSQINLTSDRAQTAACTPRLEQLAQHKEAPKEFKDRQHTDQFTYSCGRVSPVWPVDDRAKTAEERPRTNALAKHKDFHRDFLPERYLPNPLSQAAVRRSLSSERLESLSRPRYKRESQFRDSMWEVGTNARKATASPRTLELARYKPTYEGYQNNYDYGNGYERMPRLIRVISRNARNAVASSRTKELSVPIIRQSMDLVQFDPMAFIIKPTTLNAYCAPRISELAQPIVR